VEESKAAAVSAQAALNKALLDLGYCTFRSPINGRISRKNALNREQTPIPLSNSIRNYLNM
jgi:multidrug resistance efflux pump